jgi:hypothetical protein
MSSFLDFINQEPNQVVEVKDLVKVKDVLEVVEVNPNKIEPNTKGKFSFSKNDKKIKEIHNPNHNTFSEFFFKKGNFIRVIRTPRKYSIDENGNIETLEKHTRLCDIYCGYIGEIRQYFKGNDSAMVILHALNNVQPIKFPIECLVKID